MTIVLVIAATAALYAWAWVCARAAGRAPHPARTAAFAAALVAIAFALLGPVEANADGALSWHMAQHLVLIDVAAPLLLLGAPLRLALAALPVTAARGLGRFTHAAPLRALVHPAFAWLQFLAVLVVSHFSPLYEAALEREPVHAVEHVLYLASATLFWLPILAVAPAPHAPSHPVRLLAVFLALPASAFLGFAFYISNRVLYAHYAVRAGALEDQHVAGAVMWIAGGGTLFVALLWLVADWGARERRFGAIADGALR